MSGAALFVRLGYVFYRVCRKQTPWTQLLLPAFVTLELWRVRFGHQSRFSMLFFFDARGRTTSCFNLDLIRYGNAQSADTA